MKTAAALILAAALVAACSSGTGVSPTPSVAQTPSSSTSSASSVPASSSASAASPSTAAVVVGGDRPAAVQVPPGYDPSTPAPLLILLHGYSSSGKDHDGYFHLGDEAARRGYLTVHPDGTRDDSGNRFWNATDACCDFDKVGVDDATYLSGLITDVRTAFNVDPKRIYLVGHSNGGFMSYAMACQHADQIAAMASLAAATFADPKDCRPSEPVAVLEIHGTADDTILYDGGVIDIGQGRTMASYPGAATSVATWARYDGCTESSTVDATVDVDADLGTASAPAESAVLRWSGCRPGGAAELWSIPGGGHAPTIPDAFGAAVLDFFDAHPKP